MKGRTNYDEGMSKRYHIAITAAIMLFIFIQSALPGKVSGEESSVIVRLLATLLGADTDTLSLIVRKLAHLTEFAVLGASLFVNVKDWHIARSREITCSRIAAIAWIIGTLYAATVFFASLRKQVTASRTLWMV